MATNVGRLLRTNVSECSIARIPRQSQYHSISQPRCAVAQKSSFSTTSRTETMPSPTRRAIPTTSTTASKPHITPSHKPPPLKAASIDDQSSITDLTSGLADEPLVLDESERQIDWTRSFHGLSAQPFSKEAADILLAPIPMDDVEVKPDGIIYLPEIKYRRILNRAFGPGGWGLAPRGETIVTGRSITREYALLAHGRFVKQDTLISYIQGT